MFAYSSVKTRKSPASLTQFLRTNENGFLIQSQILVSVKRLDAQLKINKMT